MNEEMINFKQERDFGGIINASIVFVKQNIKEICLSILIYGLPFILLASVINGFMPVLTQMIREQNLLGLFYYYVALMLGSIIQTTGISALLYAIVILYIERGPGQFTVSDIWNWAMPNLLKIFAVYVVVIIALAIAAIFLILPAIYLAIVLVPSLMIILYEKKGIGSIYQRCVELYQGSTADKFWNNFFKSLGLILVLSICVGIVAYIAELPLVILGMSQEALIINSAKDSANFSFGLVIFSVVNSLVSSILQSVLVTATALLYFSLREDIEGGNLEEMISNFGGDSQR
jgi:hypothetical protein